MTTIRNGSGPTAAAPTRTVELTDADLAQILDALGLLAIEHHRHAVLAADPTDTARHRVHEHAVDELAERIHAARRIDGNRTEQRSER